MSGIHGPLVSMARSELAAALCRPPEACFDLYNKTPVLENHPIGRFYKVSIEKMQYILELMNSKI